MGEKSCLHLPCPALWGLFILSALELQLLPSQPQEISSAAPQQNQELSSSGPPHLLSWWVGSHRRSPLSLKTKASVLLAFHFSSLHSWSFTFISKVKFSACLFFFPPLLLVSIINFYSFIITALHFSFVDFSYSPCLPVVFCSVALGFQCVCDRRRLVLWCW